MLDWLEFNFDLNCVFSYSGEILKVEFHFRRLKMILYRDKDGLSDSYLDSVVYCVSRLLFCDIEFEGWKNLLVSNQQLFAERVVSGIWNYLDWISTEHKFYLVEHMILVVAGTNSAQGNS